MMAPRLKQGEVTDDTNIAVVRCGVAACRYCAKKGKVGMQELPLAGAKHC
jgi:hypothetical protein